MYETPEAMREKINEYFQTFGPAAGSFRPTVAGLAYHLGFSSRGTLNEYEKQSDFSDTIKRAKTVIEGALESRLYDAAPAGVIFNLKNNFGWQDRQVQELDVPQHVKDALWGR
jgi:hypothetical protein